MNIEGNELITEAKRVIQVEIDSLILLKNRINSEFEEAVKLISVSNKVVVSGIGKSGAVAKKIAGTFSSLGVPSVFLHPVEALHGDIGIVEKGDVVILLSKSGSTEEIVNLIPYLKSRSVAIIAVTGNPGSVLGKMSDVFLDGSVEREACPFNTAPTSSAVVALAIGDALAISTMMYKKITVEDFSRQHPLGQIGRNITLQVKDVMHSGEFLPKVSLEADIRSTIIEMTNKSLGCVCIVDQAGKLAGLITDGDIRRVLQKHDDIRGLKAVDIMTKSPVSVSGNAYLGEAMTLMESRESQLAVLPVMNNDNVCVGVIRIHDIVRSGI